jgi:hypothetical protein
MVSRNAPVSAEWLLKSGCCSPRLSGSRRSLGGLAEGHLALVLTIVGISRNGIGSEDRLWDVDGFSTDVLR